MLALVRADRADAYCRTTTKPVPSSYNPADGCVTDGLFLFWRSACIGYSLNRQASKDVPYDSAKAIMDKAFAAWTSARCGGNGSQGLGITVSDLGPVDCAQVGYNSLGPNQNAIIFRDDKWPYHDPYNTLGLTTVTFDSDTGEIFDADMEINSSGKNLSTSDQVPPNDYDLASVITHEAGHFLGLAHATGQDAIMFAFYKSGTTLLRTLKPDDEAGACAIYPSTVSRVVTAQKSSTCTWCPAPAAGQTESIPAAVCDATPRHGFTTTCSAPTRLQESGCTIGASRTLNAAAYGASVVIALAVVRRRRSPSPALSRATP
jgi:hypothetical protein